MSKSKPSASESGTGRNPSVSEIRQNIAKLDERIEQVQELMQEGLPYVDALKVKVELGVRETIKEIFGERSSEWRTHGSFAIDSTSHATISRAIHRLQDLIFSLEEQEAILLGKPAPQRRAPAPTPPPAPPPKAAPPAAPKPPQSPQPPRPAAVTRPPASPPAPTPPAAPAAKREPAPPAAAAKAAADTKRTGSAKVTVTLGDALTRIRTICTRFHGVVRQLRERSEDRPPFEVEDEFDVRDLLRALLHVEFDDVVTEEWAPAQASGTTQTDLVMNQPGIVIVSIKTRRGLGAKEVSDFWAAAAKRYAGRAQCKSLFGFIYDPEGRIGTPRRLEAELMSVATGGKGEVHILPK